MPNVTSKDGTTIGYDSRGSGPVLILVAGATQYRAVDAITPVMAQDLADRFTVVNFDRRGRGESGDTAPYAVNREIEDIEALVDAHGGKAALFGMSSGAVLALEAAAALPGKVTGAVLYEPPVDVDKSSDAYWKDHAEMAALAAEGRSGDMMAAFMAGVGMPPEAVEGFRQSPAWAAYEPVGLTIEHDYRVMAEATDANRHPARWQQATMPVLVVAGDASFPIILPGAEWVARGLPNASRKTLPGQSHEYDPKVLGPVIAEFLAR